MTTTPTIFHEMGFRQVKDERLPEAVVYSIIRTATLLTQHLATVYRRAGLTPASVNLLMLLKRGTDPESLTQQVVGERLAASPSNMTSLIDRLEAKGWIKRVPGKDRRSKLLQITPSGTTRLEEVWPQHVQAVEEIVHQLPPAEARTLVRLTTYLRRTLKP